MKLKVYELAPTRSARVRWTLDELGLPAESVSRPDLIGSEDLRRVHPMGKLPAIEADGRPLFESAAICTWLADQLPEKGLAHKPGTWERALHDQWVSFALTEMEAHVWSRLRNTIEFRAVPPGGKIPDIIPQCEAYYRAGAEALDRALKGRQHLVGDRFSVTDIIVGLSANWGRNTGLNDRAHNINRWLDGLYERPHCALLRPKAAR